MLCLTVLSTGGLREARNCLASLIFHFDSIFILLKEAVQRMIRQEDCGFLIDALAFKSVFTQAVMS
jgi:hypothetical protein